MQITAKIIQLLPLQAGVSRNGEWKKQDIVVETNERFPKKICISIWGDKINPAQLKTGNLLDIDFDIESREFNGRWYTDVKAWKIEPAGVPQQDMPMPEPPVQYAMPDTPPPPSFDDLPF